MTDARISSSNIEAASSGGAGGRGVIDEKAFAELARVCGSELPKLVRLHLQDARRLIDQMRGGLDTHDFETLWRAAHTLKSSAAMFGAMELSRYCRETEAIARTARDADLVLAVERIEAAFLRSHDALIDRSAPPSLIPPPR